MALTPEQIKDLLAKANTPRTRAKKSEVQAAFLLTIESRDHITWFKLPNRLIDAEGQLTQCDNPDCIDPRPVRTDDGKIVGSQPVATVAGKNICRYCFMEGWLITDASQASLVT